MKNKTGLQLKEEGVLRSESASCFMRRLAGNYSGKTNASGG